MCWGSVQNFWPTNLGSLILKKVFNLLTLSDKHWKIIQCVELIYHQQKQYEKSVKCSPDSCFNQLGDEPALVLWSVHQSAKCQQPQVL